MSTTINIQSTITENVTDAVDFTAGQLIGSDGTKAVGVNPSDLPISDAAQTALDAKQATLVSGTNIKTVNGSSLLGSGNLSVASETYYETGVWFPVIKGSTTNGTYTINILEASYSVIGNLVTVQCRLLPTVVSAGSGDLVIDGLPFTPVKSAVGGVVVNYFNLDTNTRSISSLVFPAIYTGIKIVQVRTGNSQVYAPVTLIGSGNPIYVSIQYIKS